MALVAGQVAGQMAETLLENPEALRIASDTAVIGLEITGQVAQAGANTALKAGTTVLSAGMSIGLIIVGIIIMVVSGLFEFILGWTSVGKTLGYIGLGMGFLLVGSGIATMFLKR